MDAQFEEQFACHSLYVQFDRASSDYTYVVRCEGARNFPLKSLDLFAALDYATDKWQVKDKAIPFNPPLVVTVRDGAVVSIARGTRS